MAALDDRYMHYDNHQAGKHLEPVIDCRDCFQDLVRANRRLKLALGDLLEWCSKPISPDTDKQHDIFDAARKALE